MTLEEALSKAEAGNIDSMVALANFYYQNNEDNFSAQYKAALPWYERAAKAGDDFSKKMASLLLFLHAYASRKALGAASVRDDYEEETEKAVRYIQSMKQPDKELLQQIREDQAIFSCELFVFLEESASDANYINKTIRYMKPYASSYKSKEALQSMVMALSMFDSSKLSSMGCIDLFIKSATICDIGHEENDLYKKFYAYIWATAGYIYLRGFLPYSVDNTAAFHCFEKACTYDDQYAGVLKKFKKKLFGGYSFRP